jgi:hypothetical protein
MVLPALTELRKVSWFGLFVQANNDILDAETSGTNCCIDDKRFGRMYGFDGNGCLPAVKKGEKYPATLITAGMNDPRVIAWQPAKFAARLQAANTSNKPILFRIDYESGHGIGDTKSIIFERLADVFSFVLWQLGYPEFQVK